VIAALCSPSQGESDLTDSGEEQPSSDNNMATDELTTGAVAQSSVLRSDDSNDAEPMDICETIACSTQPNAASGIMTISSEVCMSQNLLGLMLLMCLSSCTTANGRSGASVPYEPLCHLAGRLSAADGTRALLGIPAGDLRCDAGPAGVHQSRGVFCASLTHNSRILSSVRRVERLQVLSLPVHGGAMPCQLRPPWSQAVTLACTAITMRQQKSNITDNIFERIQQLPALPPLLEWHPDMPTTATRIDVNKARGKHR